MGEAAGYAGVLRSIEDDIEQLISSYPDIFEFTSIADGMVSVRDFGTTGVVASARGCPIGRLTPGKKDIRGRRVTINDEQLSNAKDAVAKLVDMLG